MWFESRTDFKVGHNTEEATKNICCAKGEGGVDHSNQMVQEIFQGQQKNSTIRLGQLGLKA